MDGLTLTCKLPFLISIAKHSDRKPSSLGNLKSLFCYFPCVCPALEEWNYTSSYIDTINLAQVRQIMKKCVLPTISLEVGDIVAIIYAIYVLMNRRIFL